MSKIAFLMNGYTSCGKSTAAKRIQNLAEDSGLSSILLQTNQIRNTREDRQQVSMDSSYFNEDSHRDVIYGIMLERMKGAISQSQIPILDATYNKRKWRTPIYDWCNTQGIELYAVNVVCKNETEVMKRIALRIANGNDPHFLELEDPSSISMEKLNEFLSESFRIYINIRNSSEDINESEQKRYGLKLIVYDTLHEKVNVSFANSDNSSFDKIVQEILRFQR